MDKLQSSEIEMMRLLSSGIRRARVMQKLHKCDLSPDSVGDTATTALPSSLKAPTNLLREEKKLVAMVSWRTVMICLLGVAMYRMLL